MQAVAYLRCSTDDQAASGLGLESQEHACRAWAERSGLAMTGPFVDDGYSGASRIDQRPALMDALAALAKGDVLIVAKRDRLARDPIILATLESVVGRKGARVVSCAGEGTDGDDPSSILMRRMIDAFAEHERLVIRARTRSALDAKRRRSERCGQVAYGTAVVDDGRRSRKGNLPVAIVPDPGELATVGRIVAMRGEGLTLRAIARALDSQGVPTKNAKPRWSHQSVASILRRSLPTDPQTVHPEQAPPCPPPSLPPAAAPPPVPFPVPFPVPAGPCPTSCAT